MLVSPTQKHLLLFSYVSVCVENLSVERGFQVMENLENLMNLQEMWLGRNRIKVVNLCGLKCIKKISLQSNRLTSMIGLEVCRLSILKLHLF